MKAMLLSAGKGTRLGALGESMPKTMILYREKPLLQHNIELCRRYGITDLIINVHHHAGDIISYFADGKNFGVSIEYSVEKELLGTSGAVKNVEQRLCEEPFYVLYGDNHSEFELPLLKKKNEKHDSMLTIAFHYREEVSESGVAEFSEAYRIKRFVEKPKEGEIQSHWVNAGIYYMTPLVFQYIPEGKSDFGHDVFPMLVEKGLPLYGVCKKVQVKAFDTPELLNKSLESQE